MIDPEYVLEQLNQEIRRAQHYDLNYLDNVEVILLRRAYQAIKEKMPCILTLDEIRNSPMGEVVWLEDFDKCDVIPGIRFRLVNEGGDEAIEFHVMDGFIAPKLDEYGVRWRCWNKKPTNAQRLTTAWKKQLLQYGDNDVLQSGLAPAT